MGASRNVPPHYARFFRALGHKIRTYRLEHGWTQEDMITQGFSLRHWQMIEAGRPFTVFTLLRVCEVFDLAPEELVSELGKHLRKGRKG